MIIYLQAGKTFKVVKKVAKNELRKVAECNLDNIYDYNNGRPPKLGFTLNMLGSVDDVIDSFNRYLPESLQIDKPQKATKRIKHKLIKPNFKVPYKSLEYNGPYSIEQCVEIAKKLGIKAKYSNIHMANFITEALINVTKAGLDLSGAKIKCKKLSKGAGGITFFFKHIYFNTRLDWQNIIDLNKKHFEAGNLSSPSPLHIPYHEFMHAAYYKKMFNGRFIKPKELLKNNPCLNKLFAYLHSYRELPLLNRVFRTEVSKYAGEDKDLMEFLAETGAAMMSGRKFSEYVSKFYKVVDGVEPKIISTGEDFSSKYQKYLDSIKNLPNLSRQ